jgi:hypothetical protein
MYFLIALICSCIGMIVLMRFGRRNYASADRPILNIDQWIDSVSLFFKKILKKILQIIVVHSVYWYRGVTRNITINTVIRKKVRTILFDHHKGQKPLLQQKNHLVK